MKIAHPLWWGGGGAPCPPETIRAMKDQMGFNFVVHCYGLSECGGLSTSTLIDDAIEVKVEISERASRARSNSEENSD